MAWHPLEITGDHWKSWQNMDETKQIIYLVIKAHKQASEGRGELERCDPGLNMSRWSGAEAGNVMLPHSTCMQIASVCTRHNTTGASSNKQGLIERCNWIMSNATSHNMYTHNLTNNIHSLRGKEAIYYSSCLQPHLLHGWAGAWLLQERAAGCSDAVSDHCPANGHQANSLF